MGTPTGPRDELDLRGQALERATSGIVRGAMLFDEAVKAKAARDQRQQEIEMRRQALEFDRDMASRRLAIQEKSLEEQRIDKDLSRQLKEAQLDLTKAQSAELQKTFSQTRKGQEFIEKTKIKAEQPKKLSPKDISNIQEGSLIPNLLGDIEKTISENSDVFGPIQGTVRSKNPYDVRSQTIDSQMRATSQAFGRYMEGGVLRKEDEAKYRKMFPKASDTPEVAANKLAVVKKLLATKFNNERKALESQGYDLSGISPELPVSGIPALQKQQGPNPGIVDNGYRFKGGDPSKKENWEKVD